MDISLQRSALQTMSNVDRRIRERGEDYFNAMIGAVVGSAECNSIRVNWKNIAESPLVKELENQLEFKNRATEKTESLADFIVKPLKVAFAANRFMQAYEMKGDYSFIYTTAERSKLKGQTWRPVADVFNPICPWHSSGASEPGVIRDSRLELQKMLPMQIGALNEAAQRFITTWVRLFYPEDLIPTSIESVCHCLKEVGFSPTGKNLVTVSLEDGYFFPQCDWDREIPVQVFVSSTIRWVFGAPAILTSLGAGDIYQFISVGVFVGDVLAIAKNSRERSVILEDT